MGKIQFDTLRFGRVEVEEEELITFPRGLIGFEGLRRFVLFDGPEGTPFKWLQSVEEPAIAFVVVDPRFVVKGYVVRVKAEALEPIELDDPQDAAVAVILTVPGDIEKATANLLGPIVFNVEKRLGVQVIVEADYPIRHPLFLRAEPEDARTQA